MRKRMREQSRELARQSIVQSSIDSASGKGGSPIAGNFLNHPLNCASPAIAAVSSFPGRPSINSNRVINPWFPVTHAAPTAHLKPMLSQRVRLIVVNLVISWSVIN